MTLKLEFI